MGENGIRRRNGLSAPAPTLDATTADPTGRRHHVDTRATGETVDSLMAELSDLADPAILAVNERHGDEHAVNLTRLRAVAKRVRTDHDLACALWATDDSAARLLAVLICRPRLFTADELDAMLRQARTPKVQDWLISYVVKKSTHVETLRVAWFDDPDPVVAGAGWTLTGDRIGSGADGLDLPELLTRIEDQMADAPDRLQWAMNGCLARIGIDHPDHRSRAIDIGERLEVLKDYPTARGCVSPFAPIWITEMVRRQEAG
ncbi:DNA alkylation repair protein [Gordonia desulfuricans]|uniref:DNA alkylation repair protein n=2 Tax=Gordoniaceae TaxID=85026 RepID=A0A7K3LLR2_9ACTN|nr:DNA alkylation repair protein [Gordonia desulfuricans]